MSSSMTPEALYQQLGLVGVGAASLQRGHWATSVVCLAAFAAILFLLLAGIEYANDFWEGK